MGFWSWLTGCCGKDCPPRTERATKRAARRPGVVRPPSSRFGHCGRRRPGGSALGGRFRNDRPNATDRYVVARRRPLS